MSGKPAQERRPYSSRCKVDSRGKEHWHVYLPSKKGFAWVELIDFPSDQEFRSQILDPDFLPPWKIAWLEDAYQRFRESENARKRKDTSYSDWGVEPWDEEEIEAQGIALPELYALRQAQQEQAERVVAEILLPLTEQQRTYITLSLGEQMSYADIARAENPDASQAQINKRADAIRKSVDRGVDRIVKKFGHTRPDSPDARGV